MSFQFTRKAFEESRTLYTLVLISMGKRMEAARARSVGAIAQCRLALSHARHVGLPICFVHDALGTRGGRIEGLMPTRNDRLFVRRGLSCFDSSYFAEAASGILVLAGFMTSNAIRATAHDAQDHARPLIFLEDAIVQPSGSSSLAQQMFGPVRAGIRSCTTRGWIEATGQQGKAC
ncbi:MAG TPA: isochorismatase family protein [Rhizomicrobium sp.]|nr:isochorismatase family protein [Rhizomicrobium sp.]